MAWQLAQTCSHILPSRVGGISVYSTESLSSSSVTSPRIPHTTKSTAENDGKTMTLVGTVAIASERWDADKLLRLVCQANYSGQVLIQMLETFIQKSKAWVVFSFLYCTVKKLSVGKAKFAVSCTHIHIHIIISVT